MTVDNKVYIWQRERAHERVEYLFMGGLSLDDATRSQGGRGVPVGQPTNGNKRGKRIQ